MEVEFDLRLSLDWLVVDVGRFVAPFIDGAGHIRKKRQIPVEELYVNHLAILCNRRLNRDRSGTSWRTGDLWVDARRKPTQDDSLVAAPQQPMVSRHANRPANMYGKGVRFQHLLARQEYIRRAMARGGQLHHASCRNIHLYYRRFGAAVDGT
jgi:hypothetical protein